MTPECQWLLAYLSSCLPQATITLDISKHQYRFTLFIPDEKVSHLLIFNHDCFQLAESQVAGMLDACDVITLIELSPVALRLEIKNEQGQFCFSERAMYF